MRRFLKFSLMTAAAVLAAAAVFVFATLPPRALAPAPPPSDGRLVWGAYHVHSTRSDGSGSVDEIAAAAARAGLHFVVFTDHGDGTRVDAPVYRDGVLCIDAPEISTQGGHLVALNLQRASAFPLAGEARDVIDDIHRLGGWAVAAHPESPRPELRWRAPGVRVDGFEWLNVDSEWRAHGAWSLAGAGLRTFIRGPETIASLFDPTRAGQRWNRAAGSDQVFSLAALDAHARIGADSNGTTPGAAIHLPSYSTLFRTVAQAVPLDRALTGDATSDGRLILDAIRNRRSYTIVRAFADVLAPIRFEARNGEAAVGEVPGVPAATVSVVPVAPDRYRLEARISGRPFPWLVSDVMDVRTPPMSSPASSSTQNPVPMPRAVGPVLPSSEWRIEKDTTSSATIQASDDTLVLSYKLGGGAPAGQYVALAAAAGTEPIERIEFVASSPAPMRVSVQVRVAGGSDGQRWGRSIYVDESSQVISVRLADLQPIDRRTALRPVVARVQSVLIVIDTVNTRTGSAGEIRLRNVRFVRGQATPPEPPRNP
jgi:hypothetical protein